MVGRNFMGQTGLSGRMPGRPIQISAPSLKPAENKSYISLPKYRPTLGQTVTTAAPQPMAPATGATKNLLDLDYWKSMGSIYLGGVLFGAVLGAGVNLAFPQARLSRKQGLTLAAVGTGVAALGGVMANMSDQAHSFWTTLVGIGGAFAGNGATDLVLPGDKQVCRPVYDGTSMGWRKN